MGLELDTAEEATSGVERRRKQPVVERAAMGGLVGGEARWLCWQLSCLNPGAGGGEGRGGEPHRRSNGRADGCWLQNPTAQEARNARTERATCIAQPEPNATRLPNRRSPPALLRPGPLPIATLMNLKPAGTLSSSVSPPRLAAPWSGLHQSLRLAAMHMLCSMKCLAR